MVLVYINDFYYQLCSAIVATMRTDIATTRDSIMRDKTIPVVLIRHAQSQWNKENRFTGWSNSPLTDAV